MPEAPPGTPGAPGARERILGRLRAARMDAAGLAPAAAASPTAAEPAPRPAAAAFYAAKTWPPAERLARLRRCMEAVKAEFVEATAATWPAVVRDFLRAAGARNLMAGAGSPLAPPLAAACAGGGPPELVLYDRPVEEIKASLFSGVDAGITGCLGGIAETGGLVLCPSPEEPRLLSLVPPIHLVLLDPARLWDTLWQAVGELGWARSIPPNALVISGPSKTADIEQTLAYGVHGPKRLVVVLVPGGPAAGPAR
ncbi:MAG TPA: lactate utilization protein C [Thermoanaerobaculia bacterium]|nr:lactate utilization protein C [Thermoanaerobaculia bacterium]